MNRPKTPSVILPSMPSLLSFCGRRPEMPRRLADLEDSADFSSDHECPACSEVMGETSHACGCHRRARSARQVGGQSWIRLELGG